MRSFDRWITPDECEEMMFDALSHAAMLDIVKIELNSCCSPDMVLVDFVARGKRCHEFVDVHPVFRASTFANLAALDVIETAWNCVVQWPPAPALRELTIMLVAPQLLDGGFDVGMFVDVRQDCVLECPALRTLTFSTRQRGDPALKGYSMSLPPESIVTFIQCQLRTGRRRVPILCLNGLELVTHAVDQVATLLDMVEEIQYGTGHARQGEKPLYDLLHWNV